MALGRRLAFECERARSVKIATGVIVRLSEEQ